MAIFGKTKALVLLSMVVAAAVLGIIIFNVSASDQTPNDETEYGCYRFRHHRLPNLTDEQQEEMQSMIEKFRADIESKLEEWGVEVPSFQGERGLLGLLSNEQEEELQTIREGFKDQVAALLDEYGVEKISELDKEGREALKQLMEDFRADIKNKLADWDVELPDFHCGRRFGRMRPGGFGLFRP